MCRKTCLRKECLAKLVWPLKIKINQGCQILKNKKRPNKGQIFFNFLNNKIQSWNFQKYCNFFSDFSKTGFEIYYYLQHSKKAKNGQMAKTLYFCQTISKKAKWQPWNKHQLYRLLHRIASVHVYTNLQYLNQYFN